MNRHKIIFQAVVLVVYLLLNSLSVLHAQKLTFDRMAKYERSYGDKTYMSSAYAISTDDHYFLDIYRNREEETKVYLFDFRQGKRHDYIVDVKIVGGNDVYNFRYIKSVKISTRPKRGEYYDFQSVSTDGDIETVKLIFYKNKAKTKVANTLILKNQKSDVNYFPFFRFICLHLFESDVAFNYKNGGLILSSLSEHSSAILKEFDNVLLEIEIPKNLI